MANKLTTAISFQGFSLKSTEASGFRLASDPGETSVYDGLLLLNHKNPAPLHLPKPSKKHVQKFIDEPDKRQQTRRSRYYGLAQKADDLKNLIGDEVMIVFRNADRGNFSVITTSPNLTFNPTQPTPPTPPPPPPSNSVTSTNVARSALVAPPDDQHPVDDVAAPSATTPTATPTANPAVIPTATPTANPAVIPTANPAVTPTATPTDPDFSLTRPSPSPSRSRLLKNSKDPMLQSNAPIEDFESLQDLLNDTQVSPLSGERLLSVRESLKHLQTPLPTKMTARKYRAFRDNCRLCLVPGNEDCLIGCEFSEGSGKRKSDACSYWVHSFCKGFPENNAEDFDELQFYCPEHNWKSCAPPSRGSRGGARGTQGPHARGRGGRVRGGRVK